MEVLPTQTNQRADIMGVDIDLMSVMDSYPMLKELPPQEAMVIMYFALGMTPANIAGTVDVSKQTVLSIIRKHDITKVMRRGLEMQKLFLASALGSITIAAIAEIKKKSSDFAQMSVPSLVQIIKACADVQKTLNPPERQHQSDDQELLSSLRSGGNALDKKSAE